MTKAKVWKLGDKYAGISATGKRVVKDTKAEARRAVGLGSKSSPKSKKRSVRKTAKKSRRKRGLTIPLATIGGLAAGLGEPISHLMNGNIEWFTKTLARNYAGIRPATGKFEPHLLMHGLVPLIVGASISKFVGGPPFNINRRLANAGIPLIRI